MAATPRHENGSETLYLKTYPDGHTAWVAERRWVDEGGKRQRKSAEAQQPTLAVERLMKKLAMVGAPDAPAPPPAPTEPPKNPRKLSGKITLDDYMRLWSAQRKTQARGIKQEHSVYASYVQPTLGKRRVCSLRPKDFRKLLEELRMGELSDKPSALASVYRVMHNVLETAMKLEHVRMNPLMAVQKPIVKRKNKSALMARRLEILDEFLTWATNGEDGKSVASTERRLWARVNVALLGLRPSEAMGLQWQDVHLADHDGAYIEVKQALMRWATGETRNPSYETSGGWYLRPGTKTGETRRVPLSHNAAMALRKWEMDAPTDAEMNLVFARADGKPQSMQADNREFQEFVMRSQMHIPEEEREAWPVGWTRHIATTLLLDSGAPQAVVAAMMGHTAAVENAHYYAPQSKPQRAALDSLQKNMPMETAPRTGTRPWMPRLSVAPSRRSKHVESLREVSGHGNAENGALSG